MHTVDGYGTEGQEKKREQFQAIALGATTQGGGWGGGRKTNGEGRGRGRGNVGSTLYLYPVQQ